VKRPIGIGGIARLVFILLLQALGTPLAVAAEEASPSATGSPVSFPAPEGGSLEVILSADNGAPNNGEILDGARKLQLHLQSKSQKGFSVKLKWIALAAEGISANKKLAESSIYLNKEEEKETWITPPDDAFPLGEYRAEIKIGNDEPQSINFKIVSPFAPAELVTRENAPRGYNLALAVLGGRFESTAPEQDKERHAAANLLDGIPYVFGGRGASVIGWTSPEAAKFPHEFVVSFNQQREATINAVIVDTRSFNIIDKENERLAPKQVEVWVSTTSATDGFTKVAEARCQKTGAEQLIKLPPTKAKFVKLRILSNYGWRQTQFTDLKVFEATDGPSIVDDLPRNIASPALGGDIVRFTSASGHAKAANLVDGSVEHGWIANDEHFPQDFVFAFHRDQSALIDKVIINPASEVAGRQAKTVAFYVSNSSPLDGFQEAGRGALTQERRDHEFHIGREARYLKVRILDNYGASEASLGELKIIEGSAPNYRSVLLRDDAPPGTTATTAAPEEANIATETEPNNSTAEANPLEFDKRLKGTIDPLGEKDFFKITVPGNEPATVSLELSASPVIRTSLALSDPAGKVVRQFDPGHKATATARFSSQLQPGDYFAELTEPLISLVVIWDTSGSMGERFKDLENAVSTFLDQVKPTERIDLIRFSDKVETLLPEFTSDREKLKAASEKKFFAEGGTPLYDAIAAGMQLLDGTAGNRAIIVMTDGRDTTSKLRYSMFWDQIEEKRIRLYTIGIGDEMVGYNPDIGSTGERSLAHFAAATHGRSFIGRESSELGGFYKQISDELRAPSSYTLLTHMSRGKGTLSIVATGQRIQSVAAPGQIELVLDCSGSMKEKVAGARKIDSAKKVMADIVQSLPDGAKVALRFYGHRVREGKPGACQDSELIAPFGPINKPLFLDRVAKVQALGTTPIAYTLEQLPRDFGNTPGEKMIILVTDGKEECHGSPSAVVQDLIAKGFSLRLNIVGFALADQATKDEMARVTALTNGKFFDARDARSLQKAIEEALAVPFDVLDDSGTKVASGVTGSGTTSLPTGIYTVVIQATGKPITIPDVHIAENGATKIELKKEGEEVGVKVMGP
jgi:VWFA-related protein